MNYLKELFYGRPNITQQIVNSNNEKAIASNIQNTEPIKFCELCFTKKQPYTEYSLTFCQHKHRAGILPLFCRDEYMQEHYINAIKNNNIEYDSTFPNFNESITNITQYNQFVSILEKKYIDEAIKNKNTIKIIKTCNPNTFQYEGKDYDFTNYNFKVIINNDKNEYIP